jgi:hypothetical protein
MSSQQQPQSQSTTGSVPQPVFTPGYRQRNSLPGAFRFGVCATFGLVFLYAAALAVLYIIVHQSMVWLHSPYLQASNVPYYNRPGGSVNTSQAQFMSFDWWVYALDVLNFIPLFYTVGAMLLALSFGLRGLGSTGLWIFMLLLMLIELSKLVYWLLYLIDVSYHFSCRRYPFCVARSATATSIVDPTFVWLLICHSVIVFIDILLLVIPFSSYRAGGRVLQETFGAQMIAAKKFDVTDVEAQMHSGGAHKRGGKRGGGEHTIPSPMTPTHNTEVMTTTSTIGARSHKRDGGGHAGHTIPSPATPTHNTAVTSTTSTSGLRSAAAWALAREEQLEAIKAEYYK